MRESRWIGISKVVRANCDKTPALGAYGRPVLRRQDAAKAMPPVPSRCANVAYYCLKPVTY